MNPFIYLYFLFLIFISFYIPGALLLQITKVTFSKIEHLLFSLFMGSLIFLLLAYLCLIINMPQAVIFILELFFILFLFRKHFSLIKQKKHEEQPNIALLAIQDAKTMIKSVRQVQIRTIDFVTLATVVGGIILLSSAHFSSGLQTANAMSFIGVDGVKGIQHIAEVKMLLLENPTGNTNLYDFLLSRFVFLFNVSAEDLYFRLFPLFISFMFVVGVFCLTRAVIKNILFVRLSLVISCLTVGLLLFNATHWSYEKALVITPTKQKLFDYFAKEVERDKQIIYLEKDLQKRNIVTAMTGRRLYEGDQHQLQSALKQCNERHIQKLLKKIESPYILSSAKESCLASEKVRGVKLSSKEFHFYKVQLN